MSDELFKPGTYRTSNNGDRWRYIIENMPDGNGRIVAQCERDEDAERIVREHNAVMEMLPLIKDYRERMAEMMRMSKGWSDLQEAYRQKVDAADAAIAKAEGKHDSGQG